MSATSYFWVVRVDAGYLALHGRKRPRYVSDVQRAEWFPREELASAAMTDFMHRTRWFRKPLSCAVRRGSISVESGADATARVMGWATAAS